MKILIKIILFIWQLPQNIIGLIYQKLYFTVNLTYQGKYVSFKNSGGSVSLGDYIFISKYTVSYLRTLNHEYGHCKQSLYLGPLYLLIIGIPSICWAGIRRLGVFKNISYYSFYTEKWADKLGEVKR